MNGEKTMYIMLNEQLNFVKFISDELYDFKFNEKEVTSNSRYHMLSLSRSGSELKVNTIEATLEKTSASLTQTKGEKIDEARTYVKAFFKVSMSDNYNDFYFISYNNLNEFYSAYTTNAPDFTSLEKLKLDKRQVIFEFFEDVEIEEMKFLPYNRYVYYKMKKKDTSSIIYYGIYDTKLFKVIFNTDEYIKYYMPYSDREMLIVTNNSILKVCSIKDDLGNCVDYCKYYLISTQGNKCSSSESDSCNSGEYMLVPDLICNQTCDENLYHYNGTHCGLWSYFYPEGKKYKLNGTSGCIENKKENMDFLNERLNILKCKEGFIIKDFDCVQNITCFNRCKTCKNESTDKNDQKCISCKDEYLLENENCLDNCSNGFYEKDKICQNCSDNTCINFETNSCDCKECIYGFHLNNSKRCEKCSDEACLEFETASCKCKNCSYGFYINDNGVCEKCSDDACLEYETNSCNCKKCISGFYLNESNNCENCSDNKCLEFETNSCNCKNCSSGFYIKDKKCSECDLNCGNCIEISTKCTSCKEDSNSFLYNNTCYQCESSEKCVNYINNSFCQCDKCKEGFYQLNYQCKNCISNCITCNNSFSCEKCVNNFYINAEGICTQCPKNCATTKPNDCRCETCNEHFFININYECEECDKNCKTCSNNKNNCNSCENGKYLTKEKKCDECNEVCLTCSNGLECDSCDVNSHYPYYVSDEYNKTCVENCTLSGREFNEEKIYECKPLKKKNETNNEGGGNEENNSNNDEDYFLWIFASIFGVLLIIITICICKKAFCNKMDDDVIEEISTEIGRAHV